MIKPAATFPLAPTSRSSRRPAQKQKVNEEHPYLEAVGVSVVRNRRWSDKSGTSTQAPAVTERLCRDPVAWHDY